jgi:hypothetical protein
MRRTMMSDNKYTEQVAAWREFAKLMRTHPIDSTSIETAIAYEECAEELEQLIAGNMSSIERL